MERGTTQSYQARTSERWNFHILSESSNESSLLDARQSFLNVFKPCRPFTRVPLACDQSWHWSHCPQQGDESQGDPSKFDPPRELAGATSTLQGDMNPMLSIDPKQVHFQKWDSSVLSTSNNAKDQHGCACSIPFCFRDKCLLRQPKHILVIGRKTICLINQDEWSIEPENFWDRCFSINLPTWLSNIQMEFQDIDHVNVRFNNRSCTYCLYVYDVCQDTANRMYANVNIPLHRSSSPVPKLGV